MYVLSVARLYKPRCIHKEEIICTIERKLANMPIHSRTVIWSYFPTVMTYSNNVVLLAPSVEIAEFAIAYVREKRIVGVHIVVCPIMEIYDSRHFVGIPVLH